MSKSLTDACVAGNRYSVKLESEHGYSLNKDYAHEGFNGGLPIYMHSREAAEGKQREAFVVLPYPVRTSDKEYKDYFANGLPLVDRTPESLERWRQASAKTLIFREAGEVDAGASYPEGAVRQVVVNAYERNPQARRECIAHYGVLCVVCGFDFRSVYGEVGEGYIQVHHLRRLSDIGEQYQVNPVADLRPVCPNCHAMLHQRTPPYTIEETQTMLREAL